MQADVVEFVFYDRNTVCVCIMKYFEEGNCVDSLYSFLPHRLLQFVQLSSILKSSRE
jgi:hypothetical protein